MLHTQVTANVGAYTTVVHAWIVVSAGFSAHHELVGELSVQRLLQVALTTGPSPSAT